MFFHFPTTSLAFHASEMKLTNESFITPTEEEWSEACSPPTPVFFLAIWVPIVFPLIIWSLIKGANYIQREGEILKNEIALWSKKLPFSNEFKALKPMGYHGIILNKVTMYLDNIYINFTKSVIEGAGNNIIGAFKTSGLLKEDGGVHLIQTYKKNSKELEEEEEHEWKLKASLYPTALDNWSAPCFFGMYELAGQTGLIALVPCEEGRQNDENSFKSFFSKMPLFNPSKSTWLLLALLGTVSTLSVLNSVLTNAHYEVSTNFYSNLASTPYDAFITLTVLFLAAFINLLPKYSTSVLQGFSFFELGFKLSLLAALLFNFMFGAINMIIAYWLYLDSNYNIKGSETGSSCYEPLLKNVQTQCMGSIYDCSVAFICSSNINENNFFCVSFKKSPEIDCSHVQGDIFLRIFIASMLSLGQFICWFFYFVNRKNSHRLRIGVLRDWIFSKQNSYEQNKVLSTTASDVASYSKS